MRPKTPLKRPEELLAEAAAGLKRQWPGMSLRAVAGKLGISPSYWSKILRGKKPVPLSLLPKAVKVLGLDAQQMAELQRAILRSIEDECLRPATGIRTTDESEASPVAGYRNLGRDQFWILEKWYYLPILNLFTLTGPLPDPAGIATRLELELRQVEETIDRLLKAGFVRKTDGGRLERTDLNVRFPTDRSYVHVRRYHQSMIRKASEELVRHVAEERFNQRLISSICLAGSSAKVKEARLILEEAMYRAAHLVADDPVSDEIFQLNLQFFPLSKPKK